MRTAEQKLAIIYPLALLASWIAAWLLHTRIAFLWSGATADTAYWVGAKIVLWVIPVLCLISLVDSARWHRFLDLDQPLSWCALGVLLGGLVLALVYFMFLRPLPLPVLTAASINAVIVAPLVEEIVMRGFYLKLLLLCGVSFWRANAVTSVFFVAMHLPGWYWQGKLHSVLVPIISLFVFSLILGLVKVKTKTLSAPIAIHVLNNLYFLA